VKENFADIEALSPWIKGIIVYKTLYNDYDVLFDLKHIFDEMNAPSYVDHAEIEMNMRNTKDHKYPLGKDWGEMTIQIKKALAQTKPAVVQYSPEAAELEHSQQPKSGQQGAQFQIVLKPHQGWRQRLKVRAQLSCIRKFLS